MDWNDLPQDAGRRRAAVKGVKKYQVPKMRGILPLEELLASLAPPWHEMNAVI
jgi:hypothetical protein